jgi:protein TonB
MRRSMVSGLFTLGALCLAGAIAPARAGVGAAPVAGIVAPSQEAAKARQAQPAKAAKQAQRAKPKKRKVAGKAPKRNLVRLAALGTPDLSLSPSTVLTEQEAFKALEQELSLKVGKSTKPNDYPPEARRSRWTGTSLVQVRVGVDGMVRDAEIQRSSGYEVLDERALAIVRRVAKLYVPFRLRGREHAVTVPVGFYLKEV